MADFPLITLIVAGGIILGTIGGLSTRKKRRGKGRGAKKGARAVAGLRRVNKALGKGNPAKRKKREQLERHIDERLDELDKL